MGKWTLALSNLGWVIDLSLNIMSVSWQRVIFCLLSALKSFQWWCTEIIALALLLLSQNWDFESQVWAETSRSWAWQFVNVYYECELIGSDYLPSISFEKFLVREGWMQWDYNVSSASFLTELRLWELSWADREWLSDFYQLWKVSGGWWVGTVRF